MAGLTGAAFSVLMVGHSLFGDLGPALLDTALSARQGPVSVQRHIINGAPLRYNWDRAEDAQDVNARQVLPHGDVTHLILTEALPLANHIEWSATDRYAMAFAGLALDANPDTQIYLQETWHSLDSGTGIDIADDKSADVPWRDRLRQDLEVWENVVVEMRRAAPQAADRIKLIPAGQAMGLLSDEIAVGKVPGLRDISAVFDDDIHLNVLGHYFVSMVQYAVLTGNDPAGLPRKLQNSWGTDLPGPDAALAAALQRIAWQAVQRYGGVKVSAVTPKQSAQGQPLTTADPPKVIRAAARQANPDRLMGVGLSSVTDWSTQQPFLDVMKTARPWFAHLPGRWGGISHDDLRASGHMDAQGWPLSMPDGVGSLGTVILTDIPEGAVDLAGKYVLRFEGSGIVEVSGRAQNVRYDGNNVLFDYAPGQGLVDIRIQRMSATDPVREMTVVREDRADLLDQGALFNPDWLARITQFDVLRYMDWMDTNGSTQGNWAQRPKVTDANWSRGGVPLEVMVALANQTGTDAWFNMPHLADDPYVAAFARQVADTLDPALTVYVEFSNEVWNWQFAQTAWADAQAKALWRKDDTWMQYYALRAARIADIWSGVFGGEARSRLVNVVSSQTGWLGLETEVLEAPLVVAMGHPRPAEAFDAYAITGYFGGILGTEARADMMRDWLADSEAAAVASAQGLSGQAREDHIARHRFDLASERAGRELVDGALSGDPADTLADLIGRVWPYHAKVAERYDLDLIMYEGGTHVVGIGPQVDNEALSDFFRHFNYTPEMGRLYAALLEGWYAGGGKLFNAFGDVYQPTKWGSWGALRHLSDDNPRWDALVAAR